MAGDLEDAPPSLGEHAADTADESQPPPQPRSERGSRTPPRASQELSPQEDAADAEEGGYEPIRRHITFQQPAEESDSEAKRAGSSDVREPSPSASTIIYVCLNGDELGRPLMVDPKTMSSLAALLSLISKTFTPAFGKVTRLLTPEGSPLPATPLLALPADQLVVASGPEPFRRLPYRIARADDPAPRDRDREETVVDPLGKMARRKTREDTSVSGVKSRILDNRFFQPPVQFFVLPNGDETGMPVRVRFTRKEVASLDKLMDLVTDRLQLRLRHGSVIKIVTLDGRDVVDLDSLRDGQFYVAVDRLPVRLPPFTLAEDGTLVRRAQAKPTRLTKLPTMVKGLPSAGRAGSTGQTTHTPPSAATHGHGGGGGGGEVLSPTAVGHPHSPALAAVPVSHAQTNGAGLGRSATDLLAGLDLSGTAPRGRELGEAGAVRLVESLCEQLLHSEEDAASVLERLALLLRDKAQTLRGGYPEACTAYDDRVEEILTIMMRTGDDAAAVKEEDVREKFEVAVLAAVAGRLAHWELSPMPFVGLVILLDQFPRTIYRGTADMYMGDAIACQVVMRAIFKSKIMDEVHPVYRLFPCLALSHQEDLEMQRLCVSEWARATQYFEPDDPIMSYTSVFKHNYDTVRKFGRFPDRNQLLGRTTTDDERAVLGTEAPKVKPNVLTRLGRMRLFGSMAAPHPLKE